MSFSDDIRRFTTKTVEAHDKITRLATLELFRGVILATPVGNPDLWKNPDMAPPGYVGGRARGSWQCTVGSPAGSDIERIDDSGSATVADAESKTPQGAGQVTFLTSNLSYIERLEMGWSTQAPPGAMVRKNMDRVGRMVDAAIRKHRV